MWSFPPTAPDDLRQPPLDRHVDVLVAVGDCERSVPELGLDLPEPGQQLIALGLGDDSARRQHRGVRAGLRDVVRRQPHVERDRVVQRPEGCVLRGGEQ